MTNQVFDLQAQLLKVLANPKRLEIIHLLRDRTISVSEIVHLVGAPQANISQHLAVLREAGVVRDTKIGKKVFYSLAHHNLILTQDLLREIFVDRIQEAGSDLGVTPIQNIVEKRLQKKQMVMMMVVIKESCMRDKSVLNNFLHCLHILHITHKKRNSLVEFLGKNL
jgi:DNA-binding transcriptional ArsR family regulator